MSYLDIYNIEGSQGKMGSQFLEMFKQNWMMILISALIIVALIIMVYYLIQFKQDLDECNKDNDNLKVRSTKVLTQAEAPLVAPIQVAPPKSDFNNKEQFSNDLPYELQEKKVNLALDDNYNDFIQEMALDQNVIKQHNAYVTERNKITSTASFSPSRSDSQDIVTTVGLTKPKYIKLDPSARQIPSQDPEQGSAPIELRWK